MASSSAVRAMVEKAKLAEEAKAKLAPRNPARELEGTIGELKAAVEAAQIAGDAKQVATAKPHATYADDFNEGRSRSSSYMDSPVRHSSASSLASSTAARANAEKAKLKPEAAAAPQRKAVTAGELISPVVAAHNAGAAKQAAEQPAAKPAAFETATGTAAAGANGPVSSDANLSRTLSRAPSGPCWATRGEVRAGHLGCATATVSEGFETTPAKP